jgi:hypothetical protein
MQAKKGIVIWERGSTVFELFSSKDQTLLIGRNAFFILDFGLDIVDGVRGLDLKGNGLTRQSLDENLHYASVAARRRQSKERGGSSGDG